jgi:hypothetical protein
MLDCHPDICCRGEGLFWRNFAVPLEALMEDRRRALTEKNTNLFRHTGGYPLPPPDHAEALLGTAVLLALRQQSAATPCRALGEKTPENIFFFPRLKALFPRAKLIAIARDPRDALASAWHMFYRPAPTTNVDAAKLAFVQTALPPILEGTRAMLAFAERYKGDFLALTYEELHRDQPAMLARMFAFLGVSTDDAIIADCVARTAFTAQSGGRRAGEADEAAFHRRGLPGGWEATLTPEMNDLVLRHLAWAFPAFGWKI